MSVADFATELDALQGFEPRSSDSESDILPLDDRAVMFSVFLIIYTEYQAWRQLSIGDWAIIEF